MELPYDTITDVHFSSPSPGLGTATFSLAQVPLFYHERISRQANGGIMRSWDRCADWTECGEASATLCHRLAGPVQEISQFVLSTLSVVRPTGNLPSQSAIHDVPSGTSLEEAPLSAPSQFHGAPYPPSSVLMNSYPAMTARASMVHHPSLERLRTHARRASTPLVSSPLSQSMPNSPYPHTGASASSPPVFYLDSVLPVPGVPFATDGNPTQLSRLPITIPTLPVVFDENVPSPMGSPYYDSGSEPPSSLASTPYVGMISAPASPWSQFPHTQLLYPGDPDMNPELSPLSLYHHNTGVPGGFTQGYRCDFSQ